MRWRNVTSACIPWRMRPTTLDSCPSPYPARTAPRARVLANRLAHLVAKWRREDRQQGPSTLVLRGWTASSVVVKETPLTVECTQGVVWVTHDADPGDHVLAAGQRFVASGPGRLVLFAFAPSRVVVFSRCRPQRTG